MNVLHVWDHFILLVHLGNWNVTIGAGAVVIKDVTEENVTVVGVPARIIKK